ncbi:MAG: DUF3263 domain-containing protein [Acidimicrobiales bacterium]|nr:DUF3263 domain-containing protein [Acidimicrobiales bacterium]
MEESSHQKLSQRDLDILEFEQSWWESDVPKDQAVREQFQLTESEYALVLDELIASDEALVAEPLLVRRLRRIRDRRRQEHTARRTADQEVAR